jgi:hypothetical protein
MSGRSHCSERRPADNALVGGIDPPKLPAAIGARLLIHWLTLPADKVAFVADEIGFRAGRLPAYRVRSSHRP